jgi:broad specificity phosphatase PhoE
MEWNYGKYEGLTSREIHEKAPGWLLFNDGCPDGETPEPGVTVLRRIIARARGAQGNVALFSHGHLLSDLAARRLGFPSSSGRHFLLIPGLSTLSAIITAFQRLSDGIGRSNSGRAVISRDTGKQRRG